MKAILSAITMATLLGGCTATAPEQKITQENKINNVIMIVADGMGPAYTTAYRYYADNPDTPAIEATVFDIYLVGSSSTYPAPVSGYVTDSAASATALASGVKSYNGAIGVDVNKQPVETVLHRAKANGKKTGVVVTSQVNHATPASYITHNEYRRNYNAIADSYIDNGINVDVLLGGGWKYFIREDRNLVKEFQQAGFDYIDQYQQLATTTHDMPLLGLFADEGLPSVLDDKDSNRLLSMTKTALKHLENPDGFFMLIEASQVDWAGHANDINSAMAEMQDLADTLEFIADYVANNPDTQVVLTADHSTGGFTLAANGDYIWNPELIRNMKQTTLSVAKQFVDAEPTVEALSAQLANTDISEEDIQTLHDAKTNVAIKLEQYEKLPDSKKAKTWKPNVEHELYRAINKIVDAKTNTGWTTSGHTAVDVPVFAIGKASHQFAGYQDNTDIAKRIFDLLKNNRLMLL